MADSRLARKSLDRMRRLSKPFGTEIKVSNSVGVITV